MDRWARVANGRGTHDVLEVTEDVRAEVREPERCYNGTDD